MEIRGVGIDIVDIDEFKKLKNMNIIFTEKEMDYCESKNNKYEHFAARFAAKEAVFKSFGIPDKGYLLWKEIEVAREEKEKPKIILYGNMKKIAFDLHITGIELSISHTPKTVVAIAIALL